MDAKQFIQNGKRTKAAEDRQAMIDTATKMAGSSFPQLVPYAPDVTSRSMKHLPHVAGMYDDASRSVVINSAAQLDMDEHQMAGLIALERARGFLYSPLGKQFLDKFQLEPDQANWWEKFYLPAGVDAPTDQNARHNILKSTILSRLLVGDQMPEGAPPLNEKQMAVGDLFGSYAARR